MSDDDFTRHPGGRHQGPASTSPYPVSRLAPPHDLVDVAREVQKADALIAAVATDKLQLIAEQIRMLQAQARAVLEAAQRDADLHRAACNFQKRPGKTYHLYRRPDGRTYLSMLSPADWRDAPPHEFIGSYRLEVDLSWTPADQAQSRDERAESLRKALGSGER